MRHTATWHDLTMTVRYIEAPNAIPSPDDDARFRPRVFLAGGISHVPDWQRTAVQLLEASGVGLTVLNPRRSSFDLNDPDAERTQVDWEFDGLEHLADVAMFFFPDCDPRFTEQPIAMFELGAALQRRRQKLVLGIDHGYSRAGNLSFQFDNARRAGLLPKDFVIHTTLEATVGATVETVRTMPQPDLDTVAK